MVGHIYWIVIIEETRMNQIERESPIRFNAVPAQTEVRDNWIVTMRFEEEGLGPWLVDLSHKTRWDLQDANIDGFMVCGHPVPAEPGRTSFSDNLLVNRMNRTQASIYHLGAPVADMPAYPGYTDVTEATVFLALFGPKTFWVVEKLTSLDFSNPANAVPFLLQGPFCHVPCQIVALERAPGHSGGILLTCSRGYGDSMMQAILEAGEEFGIRPAGENRFSSWVDRLMT